MINVKQKVKEICDEVYKMGHSQIIIDLVQDNIEELLEDECFRRDDIGAECYQCSILLEIYNPILTKDISFLLRLESALRDWEKSHEETNKLLGLPPED